ncbi:MAG TPA: hypothetical protein VG498_13420 [Terriglobales bacterium]|nr:hypothetical protein [Terriglobales bacterium]
MRDGFREVLRDPTLLLIEIGWRWSFGILAILVFIASVFLVLGGISVDSQRLNALAGLNLWQLEQTIANSLVVVARQLLRIGITAILFLAFCWTCLSAFGRYATIMRPAFMYKPRLGSCFAISAVRAAVAVGAIVLWIVVGAIAGTVGAAGQTDALPNPGAVVAILVPTLILLFAAWSWTNWYLSLAPLFSEQHWQLSVAGVWSFVRSHRDRIFEISIVSGMMRAVLFAMALILSLAMAAVITNPRVLLADLTALSLLYFMLADFIYVARLAAFGKLATDAAAQTASAVSRPALHVDASSHRTEIETPVVSPQSFPDQS